MPRTVEERKPTENKNQTAAQGLGESCRKSSETHKPDFQRQDHLDFKGHERSERASTCGVVWAWGVAPRKTDLGKMATMS